FRPEILGRIDRIYVFKPLEGIVTAEIAAMKIRELATSYALTVNYVAPEVLLKVLEQANKVKRFGMRALEGVVNDMMAAQMVDARSNKIRRIDLALNQLGEVEITKAPDA